MLLVVTLFFDPHEEPWVLYLKEWWAFPSLFHTDRNSSNLNVAASSGAIMD